MANPIVTLPWGNETCTLTLPSDWVIEGIYEPSALSPVPNPRAEIERGLADAIGSQRMQEIARPDMKIALVIDDASRPTPVNTILPAIFAELARVGIGKEQVTLVPAVGLHRGMEETEVRERVGADIFEGMKWENPDCDDPQKLSYLGTTQRGTPVWVSKTVAEADLVVSVGCIEPHIIASFGGGYKNIIPGVAGRQTTAHNHSLNCAPGTFNNVGLAIENNPMRLDLEEAGRMLKGQVFIANTILNYRQELVRLVAGDGIQAHRAGAKVSAEIYGVKVDRHADIVITSSHPMDIDLRQGVKAMANTIRAVRPGGAMVTLVHAREGTGVFGLANRKLPLGRRALKLLAPVLLPLVPRLKIKGLGEEDKFFLYFALQAMRRSRNMLYAPTIPAHVKENLPFVYFVPDPQTALDQARMKFPGKARVVVFPHGGITYPDMS